MNYFPKETFFFNFKIELLYLAWLAAQSNFLAIVRVFRPFAPVVFFLKYSKMSHRKSLLLVCAPLRANFLFILITGLFLLRLMQFVLKIRSLSNIILHYMRNIQANTS